MIEKRDPRLERFWKQADGMPTREDDEERMRAYIQRAEENGLFGPTILDALKKLMEKP